MDRRLTRLALTAALVLLPVGNTRAEFVNFSYSWFTEFSEVIHNGTTVRWYEAAGTPSTGTAVLGAATPTPLGALTVTTNGDAPTVPVSLSGDTFRFRLNLHDTASGSGGGSVVIEGALSGEVGVDTSTAVLTFPKDPAEFVLGDHVYRVWLPDVAVPAWLGANSEFFPQLTVNALGSSEQAPEPSTLALSAAAALGLAARRWLRRRRGAD